MNRAQQQATRELERAQERWLEAYHWVRTVSGRWTHPKLAPVSECSRFDALQLTRAQPLIYGAV